MKPAEFTFEELKGLIGQIAKEVSPDYPGIETCTAWEQMWAIRNCYAGTCMALQDWRDFAWELAQKAGMSEKDYHNYIMSRPFNPGDEKDADFHKAQEGVGGKDMAREVQISSKTSVS